MKQTDKTIEKEPEEEEREALLSNAVRIWHALSSRGKDAVIRSLMDL